MYIFISLSFHKKTLIQTKKLPTKLYALSTVSNQLIANVLHR